MGRVYCHKSQQTSIMAEFKVNVAPDHVASLTRSTPISAIMELIWNSLDAEATEIRVNVNKNAIGGCHSINVVDNGSGLEYEQAKSLLKQIGGSHKINKKVSPKGRVYHGKEGKGRYKALSIGSKINITSTFEKGNTTYSFDIVLDKSSIEKVQISDPRESNNKSGFNIEIINIYENTDFSTLLNEKFEEKVKQELAHYQIRYPDFTIYVNQTPISFDGIIKSQEKKEISEIINDNLYEFEITVIEWNLKDQLRKTFFCGKSGTPYEEKNIGFRTPFNLSVFIKSDYIDYLNQENQIITLNTYINDIYEKAKAIGRSISRKIYANSAKTLIATLKQEGVYPYQGDPTGVVETAERQVFDILTLNIAEHLDNFSQLETNNKALTLSLVKVALETDSKQLRTILESVLNLPDEKVKDLYGLLESVSLSDVIDLAHTVKNRIACIDGLTTIIYDSSINKSILERKHLHKILVKELWIFGDQYLLGADDNNLKNVLKSHLTHLGRNDIEETLDSQTNGNLENKIPDICLWQQYHLGDPSNYLNLVIELKKPTVSAGFVEYNQIMRYANEVVDDDRFDKNKTRWVFILLTKSIKGELDGLTNPIDREVGHVHRGKNFDVFIYQWSTILQKARGKLHFLREKLNFSIESDEVGLEYLRNKHSQYLPTTITDESSKSE